MVCNFIKGISLSAFDCSIFISPRRHSISNFASLFLSRERRRRETFLVLLEDEEENEDPGDGQKAGCGGGSPPFRRPRWLGAPPRRRHPGPPSFLEANGPAKLLLYKPTRVCEDGDLDGAHANGNGGTVSANRVVREAA